MSKVKLSGIFLSVYLLACIYFSFQPSWDMKSGAITTFSNNTPLFLLVEGKRSSISLYTPFSYDRYIIVRPEKKDGFIVGQPLSRW